MAGEPNEKVSFSAPKTIMTMVVTALIGGWAGYAATGASKPADAVQATPVGLTRAEVQWEAGTAAAQSEQRSKVHTDAVGKTVQEDGRRDLSNATTTLNATLLRLEGKVDTLGTEITNLKVGLGKLESRSRR